MALTCSVSTDFALDILYRVEIFLCTIVIRLLEFVRLDLSRNCCKLYIAMYVHEIY